MSKLAKALTAAAGNAGESLYVEDVFSTYLYTGSGAARTIENGIALGDFGVGTSTQFNGTSDYLNRSSDLSGNSDGKTFTFSCWVFLPPKLDSNQRMIYATDSSDNGFMLYIQDNNTLGIEAWNGGVRTLQASTSTAIATETWTNIIISLDTANSSNRSVYFNDVAASVTWSTYNNANIEFTRPTHYIGAWANGTRKFYGNVAHLYLDYTYRDLSTQSNRRIFIDDNGGSTAESTLAALSPIVYLPMTTSYSVGENAGTGGDFTANGSPTIVNSGTEYKSGYGEGGLVWIKARESANGGNRSHVLSDTERGATKSLFSDTTGAELTYSDIITAFNSNGFTSGGSVLTNYSAVDYASWTFRKAEKFFDIVTYTGNSTAGRTIPHNLGSVPACIIVKLTSGAGGWVVYHVGADASNPEQKYLQLNSTNAVADQAWPWNDTAPTDTEFTVGIGGSINNTGDTYVAYLFASDAGGFGDDENIIKCGSYTGTGSTSNPATVDCGFEPQWVLIKNAGSAENWVLMDSMRGILVNGAGDDSYLSPNNSDAEATNQYINLTATGFEARTTSNVVNENGKNHIYIAIRRPMKTPESGTEVFAASTRTGTTAPSFPASFDVVDAAFRIYLPGGFESAKKFGSRLTGARAMYPNSTAAEVPDSEMNWDYMDGWNSDTGVNADVFSWMFKRATGFFDVVAYSGNSTAGRTVDHNLGVAPELMIVKKRNSTGNWQVYHAAMGNTKYSPSFRTDPFYTSSARWNDTSPTESQFTLGADADVNGTGNTYIAYLFATLDGVSKVGSYTGTGSDINVDCGFSAGARFILIKRADTEIQPLTGWYVYDSERGIVAGNDPYLLLNTEDAEVTNTDYIDPLNAGFTVTSSANSGLNASGGTYIFLAIA